MIALHITGNGFAKAGLRNPKTSINTNRAKSIFVFSKLQKNKKRNGFLRLIMTKLSTQEKFNPAFCKYYVPVAQPLFKDTVKRFQK
ncbi:hypothetical protein EG338_12575 [Kaistella haifensis]|nr:hypothetical protein EG338_12575 [Kaistella haifensis]